MRDRRLGLAAFLAVALVAACVQLGGGSSGTDTSGPTTPVPPGTSGSTCVGMGAACTDTSGVAAYGACAFLECNSAYSACFGPSYAAGTYVGDCADFATCVNACSACDATCVTSCTTDHLSTACTTCLTDQVQPCLTGAVAAAKCSAPCDVDAGTDASDGTCAALAQCCANVPQVDTSNCQSAYASANGVDAACVDPLALYRAQGKCF